MSEFIADAKVRVLPDLSQFTTELTKDLNKQITAFNAGAAKRLKPIQVPVAAGAISKAQLAGVAAGANQANAALAKTGASAVAVRGNLDRMNLSAGKSRAALLGAGTATARLDAALLGLRTAVGSTAVIGLGAAALAAIALGKAIRSTFAITVAFERELNVFQATTGATASEMERVAAAAKQLGADVTLPAVSAADAAVAMAELAKAGLSVQDSIDGARGVLQLATAANIGFADAVELAASALNAFELTGKDAVKVADTLANAANLAQGSISDIGLSLSQSAAVGRQAGLTFQDTTGFLTLLARAGLKGSDAGTSLRTALIRLINPTAKAAAIIDELGVSIRDEAGNIRPDVFIQFANAMRGMSDEARDAKLAIIGGQDALRAFAILGRTSAKDFIALRAELRTQGTAAEVAAARTKGLGGAMQALQSTLETVAITLGQKVAPGMTEFVNSLTASVSTMSESQGIATAFAASLSAVGIALNTVGAAAATVSPLLLGFTNALGTAVGAIGVEQLLAAAVAFKVLRAAQIGLGATAIGTGTKGLAALFETIGLKALYAAAGVRAFFTSLTAGAGIAATFRVGLAGIAAALTGPVGIAIGVAAAAAGIVYLITRESEAERATRHLKEATDALAGALDRAKSAAEGAASAQRGASTGELAVAQAKLAKAQAESALASSAAAKGSIERRALEINLAVAIQNVTFATQDYAKAMEDLTAAQDANRAAQDAIRQAQQDEISAIEDVITATERQIELEQQRPRKPGGFSDLQLEARGREKLIETLRKQAAVERLSDDAAVRAGGKRKQLLADLIATTKKIPRTATIEIIVKEKITDVVANLTRRWQEAGFSSAEAYKRYLLAGLGIAKDQVSAFLRGPFADAVTRASEDAMAQAGKAGTEAFKGALSFDEAFAAAEARGASDIELLRIARTQQAKAKAAFDRLDKATRGGTKFKTPAQETAFNKAVEEKNAADERVDTILDRLESDAKAREADAKAQADRIADARNKADQAIIDAISGVRTTAQNKALQAVARRENAVQRALEAAGDSETLRDDVKAFNLAIAVTIQELKLVNKRIKDTDTKIAAQKKLQDRLRELRREKEKTLREITQNAIDRALEKIDLDIELASIKGNAAAERKARLRKIKQLNAQLKAEADAHGKNTIRYKELRNEIAREQAAINDLNKQVRDANKAQATLMFAFLQAQQGFAANLLGNLIPGGATAGLVGNTSTALQTITTAANAGLATSAAERVRLERAGILPQEHGRGQVPGGGVSSRSAAQAQIAAGTGLGPTRSQASVQVELLRKILHTLNDIKRGSSTPEANYERTRSRASQDYGHGGGGSMATA